VSDLTERIEQVRVTVSWMNLDAFDSRKVQAIYALDEAARYADLAEQSIEQAEAAINRPAESVQDDRVNVLTREPVHPHAETLRGEVGIRRSR
jgi:hypothetical protein